jgi:glycosyltransferase involved in cell wall biosynthesis
MKNEKVLLINTQFVEFYVSGFTNRFIGLWCHLQKKDFAGKKIHWVTNRSLWNKYFGEKPIPENVTILNANLKLFKFSSRLFYPFYIIYLYYRKKCTSVHVATSIIDSIYLVRLFNVLKIPYCFTFASNSLEMAGYNSERMKKKWQKLFSLAKNIEVLNPTNSINNYRGHKFISPTSFPYLTEFNNIPQQLFINDQRNDTIVFCGTFVAQKNPLLAIEGFVSFLNNYDHIFPEARLVLIGKGDLKSQIGTLVEKINSEIGKERISILTDNNLIHILSSSKVFLSLQDYDNYPSQALMEAMLFCNSIISIDNGDTRRLVNEHYSNMLLADKDPQALGQAIKCLLENWHLNIKNRAHILEKFSPEIFATHFFQMHQQISS